MENWITKLKSEALDDLLAIVQRRGCNKCHDQINGPLNIMVILITIKKLMQNYRDDNNTK